MVISAPNVSGAASSARNRVRKTECALSPSRQDPLKAVTLSTRIGFNRQLVAAEIAAAAAAHGPEQLRVVVFRGSDRLWRRPVRKHDIDALHPVAPHAGMDTVQSPASSHQVGAETDAGATAMRDRVTSGVGAAGDLEVAQTGQHVSEQRAAT